MIPLLSVQIMRKTSKITNGFMNYITKTKKAWNIQKKKDTFKFLNENEFQKECHSVYIEKYNVN